MSARSKTAAEKLTSEGSEAPKGPVAQKLEVILNSNTAEATLGALIVTSFVLLVIEADYGEAGAPHWLHTVGFIFSVIYTVELLLRLYVMRLTFFEEKLNILDLFVVLVDLVTIILDALSIEVFIKVQVLRGFRTLRLTRTLKIVGRFPQVHLMVKGLMNAVAAAFFGAGLMLVVLAIFSVLAVQLIHPINLKVADTGAYEDCERCPVAFANVRSSILTFFQQVVIGDNWGDLMLPIMEEAPGTSLFFFMVFVAVHFTIMNVIMAVIVDIALKASQEDLAERVKEKEEEFSKVAEELKELCAHMDKDGSGDLTEDEINHGFENDAEFRDHLLAMDIKKEDMHIVFGIMDSDFSGTVNYEEFISELFKMKKHDSHTLLVFIKHYVTEIRRDVQEQMRVLKKDLFSKIADMDKHIGAGAGDMFVAKMSSGGSANRSFLDDQDSVGAESMKHLSIEFANLRKHITRDIHQSLKEMLPMSTKELAQGALVPLDLGAQKKAAMPGQVPEGNAKMWWFSSPGKEAPAHEVYEIQTAAAKALPASSPPGIMSSWATKCCDAPPKRQPKKP